MVAEAHGRAPTRFTELRIHGVGNTPPDEIVGEPTVLVAGDDITSFHRGAPPESDVEAYSWGGLTSHGRLRALWVLLLPFALVNTAGWMRPPPGAGAEDPKANAWFHGLVGVLALWSTPTIFAYLASILVDVVFLQCVRLDACRESVVWLRWVPDGWAAMPGRLLALGMALPLALLVLLLVVGWWTRTQSEERLADAAKPLPADDERPRVGRLPLWKQGEAVGRLGHLHLAAGCAALALVTVTAVHDAQRPLVGDASNWRLGVVIAALAVLAVCAAGAWVTSGRLLAGRETPPGWRHSPWVAAMAAALAVAALADAFVADTVSGCADQLGRRITFPRIVDAICGTAWQSVRIEASNTTFVLALMPVLVLLASLAFVASGIARGAPATGRRWSAALAVATAAAVALWVAWSPLILLAAIVAVALLVMGSLWTAAAAFCRREGARRLAFWVTSGAFVAATVAAVVLWIARSPLALPAAIAEELLFVGSVWTAAIAFRHRERVRRLPFYGTGSAFAAATGFVLIVSVFSSFAAWLADWLARRGGIDVEVANFGVVDDALLLWDWYQIVAFGLVVYVSIYLLWALARWWRGQRGRDARLVAWVTEYDGRPTQSLRADIRRWAGRIDTMRRIRDEWLPGVSSPVWIGVAAGVALLFFVLFGGRAALLSDEAQPAVRSVVDVAFDLLPFVFVGLALVVWRSLRSRESRRGVGVAWDVLTFWPRWFHPLAPPSYAARAVPELWLRLEHRLAPARRRAVVSAHSQGSAIAFATLSLLDDQTLSRIVLVTHGSPLRSLYGRFFPAYFGAAELARLARLLDDGHEVRWRNLYRYTDPIGGPLTEPGDDPDDAGLLVQVDVAVQDPFPITLAPGELPPPPQGHSRYTESPPYRELVDHLRRAAGDGEPFRPIDPGAGLPTAPEQRRARRSPHPVLS